MRVVSLSGDELYALSASGSVPIDVPPLGHVGWCQRSGRFQGSWSASQFDRAGRWDGGPAPRALHRYAIEVDGGEAVVNLADFAFGQERASDSATEGPDAGRACNQVPDPFAGGAGEG